MYVGFLGCVSSVPRELGDNHTRVSDGWGFILSAEGNMGVACYPTRQDCIIFGLVAPLDVVLGYVIWLGPPQI